MTAPPPGATLQRVLRAAAGLLLVEVPRPAEDGLELVRDGGHEGALRLPDIAERAPREVVRVWLRLVVLPDAEGAVEGRQHPLRELLPEVAAEALASEKMCQVQKGVRSARRCEQACRFPYAA